MKRTIFVLTAAASLSIGSVASAAEWHLVELPNSDAARPNSIAYGIDDSGAIVGVKYTADPGDGVPRMWSRDSINDTSFPNSSNLLYGYNTSTSSSGSFGSAGIAYGIWHGINQDIEKNVMPIAGTILVDGTPCAFFWDVYRLGYYEVSGKCLLSNAEARGVHDNGEIVVGFKHAESANPERAFSSDSVTSPSSTWGLKYLPPLSLSGDSRAYGVNSNTDMGAGRSTINRIVGVSKTSTDLNHAVMWNLSRKGAWAVSDLGTLRKATQSAAYAVNPWGQIVGESGTALLGESGRDANLSDSSAVTWNGGGPVVLPVDQTITASVATAINTYVNGNKGKNYIWAADIVGWGVSTVNAQPVALFWSGKQGGAYPVAEKLSSQTINSATGEVIHSYDECKALGINSDGYPVGYCRRYATGSAPELVQAVWWVNY